MLRWKTPQRCHWRSCRHFHHTKKWSWIAESFQSAELMMQYGTPVSRNLAYHLLHECSQLQNVELGRRLQFLMVYNGLDLVVVLANYLIRLFASYGSVIEANNAFSKVLNPSHYSWNAIIMAHVKHERNEIALHLYDRTQPEDANTDEYTFSSVIKACSCTTDINRGKYIHEKVIDKGLQSDTAVGNALIDMYGKCGKLCEAEQVFEGLQNRDVVTWSAMIAAYAQSDHGSCALECYENMQYRDIKPNRITFLGILKGCGSTGEIEQVRYIHNQIIENGLHSEIAVGSALVDTYATCGSLQEAHKVFDRMQERNVVTWGAMIAGYAQDGNTESARECFNAMKQFGIKPDETTWGAMITGYAQHDEGFLALRCFDNMMNEGIKPNKVTFLGILKACGNIGAIDTGKRMHKQIIESGLQSDLVVASTLIDMYVRCGELGLARRVFDRVQNADIVTWNAMIAGYAQIGNVILAGRCLDGIQQNGIKPDEVTFTSILAACCHAGLLNEGCSYFKLMNDYHGIKPDIQHYRCMIDLLGRTGFLNEAHNLLQTIPRDIIGWRSLLVACRTYGNVELGRKCFDTVIQLDHCNGGGYVLMAGIYSDACMERDTGKVEELRQHFGARKKPAKSWIEVNSKVHEFVVGNRNHPQTEEIFMKLKTLSNQMKQAGYIPKLDLVLQPISDLEKENTLCGHCEKMAIAFGLISTPFGTSLRATKNLRMCMDCHNAMKIISKIEKREIIIKDMYRLHHFSAASCSCGDLF